MSLRYGMIIMIGSLLFGLFVNSYPIGQAGTIPPPTQLPVTIPQASSLQLPIVTAEETIFNGTTNPTFTFPDDTPSTLTPFELDYRIVKKYNKDIVCEAISKQFQLKYGGDLLYIAPQDDRGAWILGEYSGHFANKVYLKSLNKVVYVDYQLQIMFDSKEELKDMWLKSRNYTHGEIYNLNQGERPPFALIYHY